MQSTNNSGQEIEVEAVNTQYQPKWLEDTFLWHRSRTGQVTLAISYFPDTESTKPPFLASNQPGFLVICIQQSWWDLGMRDRIEHKQ